MNPEIEEAVQAMQDALCSKGEVSYKCNALRRGLVVAETEWEAADRRADEALKVLQVLLVPTLDAARG